MKTQRVVLGGRTVGAAQIAGVCIAFSLLTNCPAATALLGEGLRAEQSDLSARLFICFGRPVPR